MRDLHPIMLALHQTWERVKVCARAAPARAIALTAVVVAVAGDVAAVIPDDVPEGPAALAIQITTVLGAVWRIVRTGTWRSVPPPDRGILPTRSWD